MGTHFCSQKMERGFRRGFARKEHIRFLYGRDKCIVHTAQTVNQGGRGHCAPFVVPNSIGQPKPAGGLCQPKVDQELFLKYFHASAVGKLHAVQGKQVAFVFCKNAMRQGGGRQYALVNAKYEQMPDFREAAALNISNEQTVYRRWNHAHSTLLQTCFQNGGGFCQRQTFFPKDFFRLLQYAYHKLPDLAVFSGAVEVSGGGSLLRPYLQMFCGVQCFQMLPQKGKKFPKGIFFRFGKREERRERLHDPLF